MKKVLGFSKDDALAAYFGRNRSTVSGWRARGMVPINECIAIALQHNVSLDWMILGRGKGPDQDWETAAASAATLVGGAVDGLILEGGPMAGYVDLPVLDMANFQVTSLDRPWKVPRLWLDQEGLTEDDTVMVRAAGDSMIPDIQEGQMVVVDRRHRDTDGVFLVRFRDSDTVRFKRVQRIWDGSLRLSNDNPAYAVDIVPRDEVARIEFIGYCHASVQSVR